MLSAVVLLLLLFAASNYNTRVRAAEVMVDGNRHYIVRQRETLESLYQGESTLP